MKYRQTVATWVIVSIITLLLGFASWYGKIPISFTEYMGFVTGAVCVWLAARDNVWNWPVGIVNALFFTILFFTSRLYADMGLQIVYIILGFLGWYWWLKGGTNKTELPITHIQGIEIAWLTIVGIISTYGMTIYLQRVNDAAPFLDALTTVTSLMAQYLLTKKRLENWYVWIGTDLIYIWLYASKGLYLTSILYLIFIAMCISGVTEWRSKITRYTDL